MSAAKNSREKSNPLVPQMMIDGFERDIQESYIRERAPEILETLLIDRTMTAANSDGRVHRIRWCTDDYGFAADAEIAEEVPQMVECPGCHSGEVTRHNGVRCRVMDWEIGKPVLFMPPFEFKPIEG